MDICSQGSVLGPLLFLIFINDIDDATDILTSLFKFADDSKSMRIVESEADQVAMQDDINALCSWADTWQMEFNASKCKVIHAGRQNHRFPYTMNGFAPGGTVLEASEMEKDLGVLVHASLKPSEQCAAAAKKANMVLGQMARAFTFRHKDTWLKLYRLYVRHHLEYCVQAWSPWTDADAAVLEQVQERAVRMTTGLRGGSYIDKLREVKMLTLAERRERGDMLETWKILSSESQSFLHRADDFSVRETRGTASRALVKDSRNHLDIRRNFFTNRVVNPWNALPASVKNCESLDAFKLAYDRFKFRFLFD